MGTGYPLHPGNKGLHHYKTDMEDPIPLLMTTLELLTNLGTVGTHRIPIRGLHHPTPTLLSPTPLRHGVPHPTEQLHLDGMNMIEHLRCFPSA